MIGYGAVLRLNLFSRKWWYTNMFTSSNIQVSHTFTMIGLVVESTLKFKDQVPKDLTSVVVYKFHCRLCNESYYGECMRRLNVRTGEHISISPLTRKQVKPKNSYIADHLLLCNYSASYDDFSILTRKEKSFY